MRSTGLPHVRESKSVLDSGLHAVDSGFHVPDSGFFVSGTWIPDSNPQYNFAGFHTAQARISRILEFGFPYIRPIEESSQAKKPVCRIVQNATF